MSDQKVAPNAIRLRRLKRSANQPNGKPIALYISANEAPASNPIAVSRIFRSAWISGASWPTICRSMNELMKIRHKTNSA